MLTMWWWCASAFLMRCVQPKRPLPWPSPPSCSILTEAAVADLTPHQEKNRMVLPLIGADLIGRLMVQASCSLLLHLLLVAAIFSSVDDSLVCHPPRTCVVSRDVHHMLLASVHLTWAAAAVLHRAWSRCMLPQHPGLRRCLPQALPAHVPCKHPTPTPTVEWYDT